MYDVMNNVPERTIKCLDKGHITLIDVMPRLVPDDQKTSDYAIVQAARVSYGDGTKTVNEDRGLIRYLMRHAHTTPFEMIEFKFHAKMPIFVARQWVRHRMSSTNEYSGRYSVMKDEFYIPEVNEVRQQSKNNKQGGDQIMSELDAQGFLGELNSLCDKAYQAYEEYNKKGVARELSRMILPVNNYTEWYWKIDLHNLMHFLALRCDSHAQSEIRVFAEAMLSLIRPIVPVALEAWDDYHPMRNALKLTRLEVDALSNFFQKYRNQFSIEDVRAFLSINSENKREQDEWLEKTIKLGLRKNDEAI
jgi:thymidylate synthase (FAD)